MGTLGICGSMTVNVGLSQIQLQCMLLMVMNGHVTQMFHGQMCVNVSLVHLKVSRCGI